MRVGPRIVLAVALLALAGAVAVLLVLPATTAVQARYDSLQQRSVQVRLNLDRLDALAQRTASARLALLLAGRPSDRDSLIGSQRQWDLAISELHARLIDRPNDLRRLDEIQANVDQFDRTLGSSLLDQSAEHIDRATALRLVTAVRDVGDQTQTSLESLRRSQAEYERGQIAGLHEHTERWRARIATAALTLVALALFIGIFLTYGVFSPLVELARLAESIAAGDRPKLQWTRRDELGEVARSMATMSHVLGAREQDLQQRSALVQLDARLGAALSAAPDVKRMAERSLAILAESLGAFAAAMFVRSSSDGEFVCEATFGSVRDGTQGQRVKEGEGPLGSVIETRRPLIVQPGPADAPRLESATVSLSPAEYRVHPVVFGQQVIAVVEIACAAKLDEAVVTHIEVLLDQLAMALSTAMVARERDKLLERLEQQYAELRAREEKLRSQSATLDHQARELSVKNEELQSASAGKSQFIATMSHELRTPLNSILGFTEMLLQRSKSLSPDDRRTLEEVRSAGRHLLTLINDILDLARIGAGKMVLRKTSVPVASIAREVTEVLRPQATAKKIVLDVRGDDQAAVDADPSRLRQILLNLVGNAVKFTDKGSVTIRAVPKGATVRVEIVDTGPGISEQDRRKLFREFSQLDSSGRRHEGSGLGLAIARELVIAHGGEIGVDSEPGSGSTFWFTMPARAFDRESRPTPAPMPAATAAVEAIAPKKSGNGGGSGNGHGHGQGHGQKVDAGGGANAKGEGSLRVLLVEDHPRNARLVESMLAGEEVRIEHVADGLLAVDRATAEPPDLVLLDLELPGIDGFEVARRLRNHSATAKVPIVAVTARALPADEARARAIGCDDFITKPIDIERLRAVVHDAMRRRGATGAESSHGTSR